MQKSVVDTGGILILVIFEPRMVMFGSERTRGVQGGVRSKANSQQGTVNRGRDRLVAQIGSPRTVHRIRYAEANHTRLTR